MVRVPINGLHVVALESRVGAGKTRYAGAEANCGQEGRDFWGNDAMD